MRYHLMNGNYFQNSKTGTNNPFSKLNSRTDMEECLIALGSSTTFILLKCTKNKGYVTQKTCNNE